MLKLYSTITAILFVGILFWTFSNDDPVSQRNASGINSTTIEGPSVQDTVTYLPKLSLRDSVHNTFKGEVGVKEEGGDNKGERITEYLNTTGLGEGYAWCAAFVSWGFTFHGVDNPQSAWSPDWFPESRTIYQRNKDDGSRNWKATDVIGIYFRGKERIAHVGVVDEVTASYVITIEGNTNDSGSREGDRVMRKKRVKRQVYKVSRWIED